MGDDVLVVVSFGGDGPVVGGVGNADHETTLSGGEICFEAGMGEGAVCKKIGHAIIAIGVGIQNFVTDMGAPGAGSNF